MQTVAEYRPTEGIQDLVWNRKTEVAQTELTNVTALQTRRARLSPPSAPGSH
jgi:hypothetical protein